MASSPKLKEILAKNLKAKREALGLTQEELAKKAKLTGRYVSRVERRAENVTLDTLESLSTALGLSSPAELVLEKKYLAKTKKAALELALDIIKAAKDAAD